MINNDRTFPKPLSSLVFPSHWRVLSVKLRELITLALKGPREAHLWISMRQSTASKHTSNSTSKARLCQYGHWHTLINNTQIRFCPKIRSYYRFWRRGGSQVMLPKHLKCNCIFSYVAQSCFNFQPPEPLDFCALRSLKAARYMKYEVLYLKFKFKSFCRNIVSHSRKQSFERPSRYLDCMYCIQGHCMYTAYCIM